MIKKKLFLLGLLYCLQLQAILIETNRYRLDYPAFSYLSQDSQFGRYAQSRLPFASASIGVYGGFYDFPTTYAGVIELEPTMLINKLPASLEQALQATIHLNYLQFITQPDAKVHSFIVIAPFLGNEGALEPVYNVVYHFFYELFSAQQRFAANMAMGLFDPFNISGTDANGIPLNRFSPIHMSTHPEGGPYAISPNNATFKVDIQKPIASCWLAALSPNYKQLSVTFLVLLREDIVLQIVQQTPNMQRISHFLAVLENMADAYQEPDRTAFLTAADQVKNLLTRAQQGPGEELQSLLERLLKQLQQLQKKLVELNP